MEKEKRMNSGVGLQVNNTSKIIENLLVLLEVLKENKGKNLLFSGVFERKSRANSGELVGGMILFGGGQKWSKVGDSTLGVAPWEYFWG